MPRRGITQDEVAQAVLQLRQAQHPVTTTNVRQELGRGSLSTVDRHLEALGAKESGKRYTAADAMPVSVRTVCDAFRDRTWRELQKHCRAREEEVAQPLRLRIRDLTTRLEHARELRERLEWEALQLRRDLAAAQAEATDLSAQLLRAQAELAVEQRLRHEHATRTVPGQRRVAVSRTATLGKLQPMTEG